MTDPWLLVQPNGGAVLSMDLDELAKDGARMMLRHALRIEADDYVDRHTSERAPDGRALVVGNGRAKKRHVTTGSFVTVTTLAAQTEPPPR